MSTPEQKPAVDGWLTIGDDAALIGTRCTSCQTVYFPKETFYCRNPRCRSKEFDEIQLSKKGTLWSYATNHYKPPAPAKFDDEDMPYTIAAVTLDEEKITVLGLLESGYTADQIKVGMEMEICAGKLFEEDGIEHMVWKWRPANSSDQGGEA